MSSPNLQPTPGTHVCAKCHAQNDEIQLSRREYRCSTCGFELAHTDVAPNGVIRGVFGYLRSVDEVIQDRYRIENVLGKGGFGATYLVEDLRLKGKRRALKEIPELLFDEHEVNLLSQLNHPAIPDIIDRFVADGMIYLVLEFGGTRTLENECKELGGRIPLDMLLPWMLQLCEALAYLHSQTPPIVHRDLKPDNILLDDNNRIMIIDFGIAKESCSTTTTRVMARAASYGFSPPEQVMGTGTDERSDIYALGATFYYLLTGRIPPPAHERVAGKELQAPSTLVSGIPVGLDEILLCTLNLNLNQRPKSIQELGSMLEALGDPVASSQPLHISKTMKVGTTGTGTSGTHPREPAVQGIKITTGEPILPKTGGMKEAPSVTKSHTRAMLILMVVVLVALAGGGYFYWHKMRGSEVEKVATPIPVPAPVKTPAEAKLSKETQTLPVVSSPTGTKPEAEVSPPASVPESRPDPVTPPASVASVPSAPTASAASPTESKPAPGASPETPLKPEPPLSSPLPVQAALPSDFAKPVPQDPALAKPPAKASAMDALMQNRPEPPASSTPSVAAKSPHQYSNQIPETGLSVPMSKNAKPPKAVKKPSAVKPLNKPAQKPNPTVSASKPKEPEFQMIRKETVKTY